MKLDSFPFEFSINLIISLWILHLYTVAYVQMFSEVPDQLGMAILSVIPRNPFYVLWAILMENFHLGIAKMSFTLEYGISENLCSY